MNRRNFIQAVIGATAVAALAKVVPANKPLTEDDFVETCKEQNVDVVNAPPQLQGLAYHLNSPSRIYHGIYR